MMEFLTNEEIEILTGKVKKTAQIDWLKKNGWQYVQNSCGAPVVGRYYCRDKMGLTTGEAIPGNSVFPDFNRVK